MLTQTAYAQTQGQVSPPQPSVIENLFPIFAILVVFWFFILRPQAKQRKDHQKLLTELKKGDQVLSSSGILGTIEGLTEKFVTLEIANNVKVKMLRSQVAGLAKEHQE